MNDTTQKKQGRGNRLSASQKLEIIEKFQQPKPLSKRRLAREYNVNEKSIRYILANAEEIKKRIYGMDLNRRDSSFRNVQPKFPEVEDALFKWVENSRKSKIELTPSIILAQAKKIATEMGKPHDDFKASWGWYQRFKLRKGMDSILPLEEEFEINDHEFPSPLYDFYNIIKQYGPDYIYSMSETGLFYRLLPHFAALFSPEDVLTSKSKEKIKSRVTLTICCNSTGMDRLPITMISKPKTPACIRHKQWPLPYFQQDNALMNVLAFNKWFEEVFHTHVRQKTDQKILLILNSSLGQQIEFERDGVRVIALPINEPNLKPPMNMGVIDALKKRYKYRIMKDIVYYHKLSSEVKEQRKVVAEKMRRGAAGIQFGKPAHLLDAAKYSTAAWNDLPQEFLKNSFQKANIFPRVYQNDPQEIEDQGNFEDKFQLSKEIYKMLQECNLPQSLYQDEYLLLAEIEKFLSLDGENSEYFQQCIKEDIEKTRNSQNETLEFTDDDSGTESTSSKETPNPTAPPPTLDEALKMALELSSQIRQLQSTSHLNDSDAKNCTTAIDSICNIFQSVNTKNNNH